ncbi:MAG: phage portal protein [Bacillota bacterium]|nr:phage portal protein [Bacillota bacterium]
MDMKRNGFKAIKSEYKFLNGEETVKPGIDAEYVCTRLIIKVSHEDETTDEAIKDFNKLNNTADLDYNLDKLAAIYGHGWEYFYQDEDAHTRVIAVKPKRCFAVYDDTVRGKALFGVRYEYRKNGKRVGEYMTPAEIVQFEDSKVIERRTNPYGMIPLVEHVMNDERIGLFEHVAGMVTLSMGVFVSCPPVIHTKLA